MPLKEPLVAIFSQRRAPTSRKSVAEKDIAMSNSTKTLQRLWWKFSVFALEKNLKNVKFLDFFLPLKELLEATFGETCALTSKKCVFEQGISIPNFLEKIQFF